MSGLCERRYLDGGFFSSLLSFFISLLFQTQVLTCLTPSFSFSFASSFSLYLLVLSNHSLSSDVSFFRGFSVFLVSTTVA